MIRRPSLAADEALPPLDTVIEPWPGEPIRLDGTASFVRRTPARSASAQPALYVHGLGGSSLNWTDLAYLLADRLDGYAIDLPGFGRSDPALSYRVERTSARLVRWIEHAGRGPVHLLGNSLGGAVSVHLAGTRPDLVRTLTLISPAMPFLNPRRSVQGRLVPLVFVPGVARIAARRMAGVRPEDLAAQVIAACFAEPASLHPTRLAEAVEEVRRRYELPWFMDAYMRTLRSLVGSFVRAYLPGERSLWRLATRVSAPTLVLTGRLDQIVDVRVAPVVNRLIPDSRLLVLDRAGHVAQMESPRIVARAVLGLLDEVAGPSAGAQLTRGRFDAGQ